ncbi:unnamed protein product [Urochloa decumbens]|uniref:Uncharacterized protein n=1 Tax=Urochloa decumbens TaxID=240449 RepID=A0ABC8WKF0_9POAL
MTTRNIYLNGPIPCIALSLWRIVQRDYGITDEDTSKANLTPALDFFYILVLCQGALYLIWSGIHALSVRLVTSFCTKYKLPKKWGAATIIDYLFDTRARCWRDPASIYGRTLMNYAIDLLGSDSWDDNLSGVRMLDVFIRHGTEVRWMLLPSRSKVQKLIDILGWRSITGGNTEIRELAARIVAELAQDIHLAQFPGAIQCVSSLLQVETTLTSRTTKQGPPPSKQPIPKRHMIRQLRMTEQAQLKIRNMFRNTSTMQQEQVDESSRRDEGRGVGDSCNQLILQGLKILEGLASDHHNCRDICSTPSLLSMIKAPVYSRNLIQDIKISDWADVVNGSFKVLYRLIQVQGKTGRHLRREISTNNQAVSNMESILDQGSEAGEELMMRAMEILTELALDLSINLSRKTREKLVKKQLQIFLSEEGEEPSLADGGDEPAAMSNALRVTAGRTLASLSTNSETNPAFIMNGHNNDVVNRLTKMIDAKNNIRYRAIAAEILENLCAHSSLDKEYVKEALLPKVLTEIVSSKRDEQPESKYCAPPANNERDHKNSPMGNDEENPKSSAQGDEVEMDNISTHGNGREIEDFSSSEQDQENDEQTATKALQEVLLSLTLVIYDKLISADDFDDVVQKKAPGHGTFAAKLKTIVNENCESTADCLSIVKLCGQIALSMMRRNQYTSHFKDQGFVESLSESSKVLSSIESCMLFAEKYFERKKIVRPLISDIEKEARKSLIS